MDKYSGGSDKYSDRGHIQWDLLFGSNTVAFGKNTAVFGTCTVVFGTSTVVFGTNTVVFGPNTEFRSQQSPVTNRQ